MRLPDVFREAVQYAPTWICVEEPRFCGNHAIEHGIVELMEDHKTENKRKINKCLAKKYRIGKRNIPFVKL